MTQKSLYKRQGYDMAGERRTQFTDSNPQLGVDVANGKVDGKFIGVFTSKVVLAARESLVLTQQKIVSSLPSS
jgi:hypothetical protein